VSAHALLTPRAVRLRAPGWAVVAAALGGLLVALVVSAGSGQLAIPPSEVIGSVLRRVGLSSGEWTQADRVLWDIRFPRLVMGVLVGASLGVAAAALQGTFANPLAEPAVLGVSAGAAVGACAAIVFNWTFLGASTRPAAAFVAGFLTTVGVYLASRSDGRADVVTIVLMGIAINAVASGVIGYLLFLGDTQAREQIVFWQLGSLNGTRWTAVAAVTAPAVLGVAGLTLLARKLDLLALGDRAAGHVGVGVEQLRLAVICLSALLVAAAVSYSGIIAFVGLIVPHIVRSIAGPGHRTLLPASAVLGALVVVVADLVARTAIDFADLPIGMLTALVGGPTFFVLLRRSRRGGWV
jgi:iron complex transport system permease protein